MSSPAPSKLDSPATFHRRGRSVRTHLERFGPLIGLVVLVGVITVVNPAFKRPENILNILHNWSFVGVIVVGMTFVIIAGGIDLSVGSLVAFAGGLGVWLMNTVILAPSILEATAAATQAGTDTPYSAVRVILARAFIFCQVGGSETAGVVLAFAVILFAGTAAGLLNGVLIAKGRIAPFIATLGGLAAYRSLAQAMADGGEFRSASAVVFQRLGTGGIPVPLVRNLYGQPFVLPWPVIIFIIVAVGGHVLLNWTRYGRHVYAVGSNERAATYSAIRVDRVKIATYTLVGGLAGLAAMMNASRMNSVSSGQTGSMWELDAIAAVVIGGTRMTGGSGSIFGSVVGLLMLGVIGNMLNLLQVSPYLHGLVKGLIIIAAVLVQRGKAGE